MSLLWHENNRIKQWSNLSNPSPTHQQVLPDPARDLELSLNTRHNLLSETFSFIKGTSLLASFIRNRRFLNRGIQAGMTVEAAIVLPLFLFFFLNMGCAIEMIRLHGNIQLALWQTGSSLSVYGYAVYGGELCEENGMAEGKEESGLNKEGEESGAEDGEDWWKDLAGIAFASTYIKRKVISLAGRDYLDHSPLKNGADSLQLWESDVIGDGDVMDLMVTYSVSPWSSLISVWGFRMANRYYAHIWNGYQLPAESKEIQMVFVTENGSVYHVDRICTHLQLSVREAAASDVKWMRNQYGRSYQACEKCVGEVPAAVWYITSQGDRFHYIRSCPGLTRNVMAVSLEEAAALYKRCSRCGGEGE